MLRCGVTVVTADDASYLAPAENFLKGHGWMTNQPGKVKYTLRSPGYGMIYASFRLFLSEKAALKGMVAFQILIFAVAVSMIPKLYRSFAGTKIQIEIGYFLAGFIAVMPIFSGFLGYTLTEGITPSLVIIFLFFLTGFDDSSMRSILAGIVLGLLILIRPAMIIWVLAPLILFLISLKHNRKKLLLIAAIGLLPIALWQMHISFKTKEFQGLHPIYQNDSNDLYRPLHRDIWNFHKSWGQTGYEFNSTVNRLWQDALAGNDPEYAIDKIMQAIPDNCIELIGYADLETAYRDYFDVLLTQVASFHHNLPIPHQNWEEKNLSTQFKKFRQGYISKYPINSFVIVPIKVYFELAAHSNLSLYIFQKPWRGHVLVEIFRYFSFAIHFGVFMLFPFAVVLNRKNKLFLAIALPVLAYIGYLILIQRGIEERYTLPVLIPMFLMVSHTIHTYFSRFRRSKTIVLF